MPANSYDNLYYWSSTRYSNDSEAYDLYGSTNVHGMTFNGSHYARYNGYHIRPVISYDDYNGTTDYNDSAVTSKVSAYYSGGSVMSNGNTLLSGSKLNFYFKNGSNESVLLTGIYLIEGSGSEGSNLLTADETIAAGDSSGYTITLGKNMTSPKCRFTYRYNNHNYSVEAAYQSFNFSNGRTRELMVE